MSAPRLLDLFCGAGGCSEGYARAGFEHAVQESAQTRGGENDHDLGLR